MTRRYSISPSHSDNRWKIAFRHEYWLFVPPKNRAVVIVLEILLSPDPSQSAG